MKTKKKFVFRHIILIILGLILGFNVYMLNANNVVGNKMPMPFGIGGAVVLSGSMEPALSVDDLIFVRETKDVSLGDIIVYESGSELIVHRVVALYEGGVVTQGDANNTPDDPVSTEQIKGKVIFSIPKAGKAVELLKSPLGITVVLAAAFVLTELSLRREKEDDRKKLESVKEEIRRLKNDLDK